MPSAYDEHDALRAEARAAKARGDHDEARRLTQRAKKSAGRAACALAKARPLSKARRDRLKPC